MFCFFGKWSNFKIINQLKIRATFLFVTISPAQIRLSEVSGVEVADRRGYLTLELETGKEGVLLLRYSVNYSLLHWPTWDYNLLTFVRRQKIVTKRLNPQTSTLSPKGPWQMVMNLKTMAVKSHHQEVQLFCDLKLDPFVVAAWFIGPYIPPHVTWCRKGCFFACACISQPFLGLTANH